MKGLYTVLIIAILSTLGMFYWYYQVDTDGNVFSREPVWQLKHDNSVPIVKKYLEAHLHDADSYEPLAWSDLDMINDEDYTVTHTYRASNGFGAKRIYTTTFTISGKYGMVTKSSDE